MDNNGKIFNFKVAKPKSDKPKKEKKKKGGGKHSAQIISIAVIVAIGLFLSLITFITDLYWFKELGYISVFLKKLITMLEIGAPTFALMTVLSFIYFRHMRSNYYESHGAKDFDPVKRIRKVSWGLAVVFGGIVTYFAATKLWFELLKFANSTKFGKADPLFKKDISFYVFKLDFISDLVWIVMIVTLLFIVMTLVYYAYLMSHKGPTIYEYKGGVGDGADFSEFDKEKSSDPFTQAESEDNPFRANAEKNKRSRFTRFAEDIAEKFGGQGAGGSGGNGDGAGESFRELFDIAHKQLIIVGVIFFVMLAVHLILKSYTLLEAHTGVVFGAGWTDTHIYLPMYRILAVMALTGAAALVYGILKKQLKKIFIIPAAMLAVLILGVGASMIIQNFVVSPDEISKESKYLERNIEYTQAAYGLTKVDVKSFSATGQLTAADILANDKTIQNIRINDYQPAEKFYNQTQSIRQYYDFRDVDVDRYRLGGQLTQVFLSPREINENRISDTWLNKHLKYTHGYGLTISRVDEITSSGQPTMLVQDIPPVADKKELKITRPEIYFGQMTDDYLVVGTDEDEFNYPDGDANKYSRYEGAAGINLSLFKRVMFAIREHSLKLLVSSNIDSRSKIVINRNIKNRVEQIMPYLSYDKDPYMVTVNGKLYWIIDAYTSSNNYPYSEPYSTSYDTNYIRNSIKIVIDAYNGNTDYYVLDKEDPIALTYQKIYPKLFKNFSDMPEELKPHIRYPNTLFGIQAKVYEKYHMNDVKVFYQKEDMWDISSEIYGTDEQQMEPTYYTLSLPGADEDSVEFVNSIPYTPKDKKNLTGLFVARNDGANYGKLILYKLPKDRVIYGPMQIEAQIDQSTEISKEFSLWNSSGSTYSRGNLFVVPINQSLLYVEPIYLEATNSSIPEVKRVIVAYKDNIAYEATLGEALEKLFGSGAGNASSDIVGDPGTNTGKAPQKLTQSQLIKNAQDYYNKAQQAVKAGDWTRYGEYMDKLKKTLDKLG